MVEIGDKGFVAPTPGGRWAFVPVSEAEVGDEGVLVPIAGGRWLAVPQYALAVGDPALAMPEAGGIGTAAIHWRQASGWGALTLLPFDVYNVHTAHWYHGDDAADCHPNEEAWGYYKSYYNDSYPLDPVGDLRVVLEGKEEGVCELWWCYGPNLDGSWPFEFVAPLSDKLFYRVDGWPIYLGSSIDTTYPDANGVYICDFRYAEPYGFQFIEASPVTNMAASAPAGLTCTVTDTYTGAADNFPTLTLTNTGAAWSESGPDPVAFYAEFTDAVTATGMIGRLAFDCTDGAWFVRGLVNPGTFGVSVEVDDVEIFSETFTFIPRITELPQETHFNVDFAAPITNPTARVIFTVQSARVNAATGATMTGTLDAAVWKL